MRGRARGGASSRACRPRASGPRRPRAGELVVSFLDVGQGDATLLQRDGAAVLVDTGPPGGPILRRLREAGVEPARRCSCSRTPQADHEGMALPVIARASAPRLVLDGGAGWPTARAARAAAGARAAPADASCPRAPGRRSRVGALRAARALAAGAGRRAGGPSGDPNDRAVVAHVAGRRRSTCCCPPTRSPTSPPRSTSRDVEALKVAHHGSADAGLPALLERLRPQVAAIEVGGDNTYGHPAPSTLGALRAVPRVFRTDRDGTVRLRVRAAADARWRRPRA